MDHKSGSETPNYRDGRPNAEFSPSLFHNWLEACMHCQTEADFFFKKRLKTEMMVVFDTNIQSGVTFIRVYI